MSSWLASSSFLTSLCAAAAALAACSATAQTPLPISGGGTGATTAAAALANLGLPILSVVNFGATGNGATDDTAAINNAVSACATRAFPFNGCNLYFPSGIYITSGITLQSYVHITGDGWATSVIQLKAHTAADVLTIPVGTFNFSITGVTLDGNSANQTTGGSCLTAATTPIGPNAINTANKQTASSNGYKDGYIYGVMFSNCTQNGVNIAVYNFELWLDDFFAYNNGVYGIYTAGTDSLFSNFVSEHNGTSGVHVANSNNKFITAKVIWNGYTNTAEAAIYNLGSRNIFTSVEAQDNYVSASVDQGGSDNQFIGCQADTNGYANTSLTASSLTASGFVINGTNGVYSGDKVTDCRGRLADGNFATEWPYTISNTRQSRIDISYDGTNQPPPTVAGDIVMSNNLSTLPPMGTATSSATDAPLCRSIFVGRSGMALQPSRVTGAYNTCYKADSTIWPSCRLRRARARALEAGRYRFRKFRLQPPPAETSTACLYRFNRQPGTARDPSSPAGRCKRS